MSDEGYTETDLFVWGGDEGPTVSTLSCVRCSALVDDRTGHDAWHRSIEYVTGRPRTAADLPHD